MLICSVLTVAYAIEVVKGLKTVNYLFFIVVVLWIPVIIGIVVMMIFEKSTSGLKHAAAIGYGGSYTFIFLTSTSPLSFSYILPLMCTLLLFKDRKFLLSTCFANLLVVGIYIYKNMAMGLDSPADISDYEIQVGCLILCYASYMISMDHIIKSDKSLLDSVSDNLQEVRDTVEKVKQASDTITDGVVVIRELQDENKDGAASVVNSMNGLSENNRILGEKTDSSLSMTEGISNQVKNVADKIENIVRITSQS